MAESQHQRTVEDDAEFDPFAGPSIALVVESSEAQREIWSAAQMGSGASLSYNESVIIRLRGALDVTALNAALGDLVQRHEALRGTFSADGLQLLIGDAIVPDLPVADLAGLPAGDRAMQREALLGSTVREEFDLLQGPLFRTHLLRLAPDLHELVLYAHHIICDGWSFGVIGPDLAALYNARHAGTAPALPAPDTYSEYIRETAGSTVGQARDDDAQYWLGQYTGAIPVLDLPSDRPRPTFKTFDAGREDRVISPALTQAVRDAARKSGTTMFGALLAGFSALLHRLSGQDDIVIGVPSAGQLAADRLGVVGHCVNMLPIRVRPVSSQPFDGLLAEVRRQAFDAFEHQRLGFGSLVARLSIPRDPSRTPLVSVLFNVDRSLPASAMPFAGLTAEMVSVPRAYENFDLFLNALETDAGLVLECQYNSDLFDRETVRRWLESYEILLEGAVSGSATLVGELPILTPADDTALAACNDTALALPAESVVHRMIESQARRTPDAVAILHDGARTTYRELNERANKLARHLQARGVKAGSLVGLCVERSPELLVSLLAALKAGAGYVPLDPNYPVDRLRYMAEDAALAVLITDARTVAEVSLPAGATVTLEADAAEIAARDGSDLPETATPEDTAYVIYTSGSTGKPKGVLVPHRSVVNLLASVQQTPGVRADDTVLAITTLSFDIAVSEVILPLTVGARIVLASRETASDGAMLLQLIEETGVTFIDATPATYRLLLAAGWRGKSSLRVICTGEAMPRDLAETLTGCVGEVWNGYGPTETTVWSTFARVTAPVKKVLIGRPVANTIVQILDAGGRQTPIGVPGELFIAGRGVTKGYLNRPDLTAERFVPDPVTPGALVYRTGDLVRLLPNGELECLGRNDNQVKVRGFRIEPGEIEAVLQKWEGVQQAIVIAREDRVNDVRLVAYLVTDSEAVISDQMRAFAKASLPDYMVPATYVRMDVMPLTPSGKVDRKALPAPQATTAAAAEGEFVAPATEAETIIAGLWADVLGLERVSVTADFFALGGHSLLASQVLSRLRRDHGIQLSFRKIFEAPTVRALAAIVDQSRPAGAPLSAPAIEAIPHREDQSSAPLSILQERLWLLEELEPAQRSAHAHSASWYLTGALDVERLDRALQALVARHATLRTSFRVIDGERRQIVSATGAVALDRRDISAHTEAEQQQLLVEFFREQQYKAFDLATAPLFRAVLFRVSDSRHLLYTLQHGLVWDGWSFDLFLKELSERYAADEEGREAALDALPVTYGDFATWQSGWLAGGEAKAQGDWWRTQLAGELQELTLPTDFPRPRLSSNGGTQISLPFTVEEADELRALARRYDVTLYMVVFAAFNVILHHYTEQDDILVGSPVRARTRPELEGIVGPFVNTVILRTKIRPGLTFPEMLRAVKDVTLDSFSNQELPFELLGTRVPPVRALFSMQDARERPYRVGSLQLDQYHVPQHFTTNDLMLWMMDTRTKLYAVLNYSTELFERSTAEAFLVQLRTFLMAVLANPEREITSVEIGETTPMVSAGAEDVTTPVESIGATIARVAGARPDAIAVRAGRKSISYGDLVSRARCVAGALRAEGVTAGAAVAIALPTDGIDQVVATLGVLMAGAAVLSLDPDDAVAYLGSACRAAGARMMISDGDLDAIAGVQELEFGDLLDGTPVDVSDGAQASAAVIITAAGADATSVDARALARQAHDMRQALSLTANDMVIAALPIGAPASMLERLMPLAAGARLVLASADAREDGEELMDLIEATAATVLVGGNDVWRLLLATPWKPEAGFRGVAVTGARLAAEEFEQIATRVPVAFTLFGLPAHGGAASLETIRALDVNIAASPVGLGGASLHVVDAHGRSAPVGVPGQLVVVQGATLDRTSLRARRLASGRIQITGDAPSALGADGMLADRAVIEAAVRQHAGVADAAVRVHTDGAGAPRVVAYVVPGAGARVTETDVRTTSRAQLPQRFVPQRVVELSQLPRTANGSVNYAVLPSPFVSAAGSSAPIVEPRTPTETVLADAWREVLGVTEISVTHNFFQLGGTSLLSFRVVETVRKRTGQHLSPRALLLGTLEQAAAEVDATAVPTPATAEAEPPVARDGGGVFSRLKGLIS